MPTNPELAKRIRNLEQKVSRNPRSGAAKNPRREGERARLFNAQAGAATPSQAELTRRIRELEKENDELQDQLDKVADLAAAPQDEREEDPDELVDKLNDILDIVAPDEDEDEEFEGNE